MFSDPHSNSNIFVPIQLEKIISMIENHIYLDLIIVKNLKKMDDFVLSRDRFTGEGHSSGF
jgi:hypothetical protein